MKFMLKSGTNLSLTFLGFIQNWERDLRAKLIVSGLKRLEPYDVKFYQYNSGAYFLYPNGRLFSKDSTGKVISVQI